MSISCNESNIYARKVGLCMIIIINKHLPWNGDLMSSCEQGARQSLCQTKYVEHGQGRYGYILDKTKAVTLELRLADCQTTEPLTSGRQLTNLTIVALLILSLPKSAS